MNYRYGFLEGECRRAINAVGLEPSVGFLHDFSDYQTKQSLVYDLEEPFRWLVDLTVMETFESRKLDVPHFYFMGDDYRYRFESDARQRSVDLIRERFNSGVSYKGRVLRWDSVVEQKASELGRFLIGKSSVLDFVEPTPEVEKRNDQDMRVMILGLISSEASRLGIRKNTFHYLHHRAANPHPFNLYGKVRDRFR